MSNEAIKMLDQTGMLNSAGTLKDSGRLKQYKGRSVAKPQVNPRIIVGIAKTCLVGMLLWIPYLALFSSPNLYSRGEGITAMLTIGGNFLVAFYFYQRYRDGL